MTRPEGVPVGVRPPAGRVLVTVSNGGRFLAYCAECGSSVAAEPECPDLFKAGRKHLEEFHAGEGEVVR